MRGWWGWGRSAPGKSPEGCRRAFRRAGKRLRGGVLRLVYDCCCGAGAALCLWFMTAVAVLARRFASVHACLFSFVRKKETACDILRSCSAGSRSPLCVLAALCGYRARRVHFGFGCFFMAISTGDRGRGERGVTKKRGWRRGFCASLRNRIGFAALSAGRTLGLRAPDCAKESSTLWTLFTLRRGYVGGYSWRECVFARAHWLCGAFRGEYVGG